MRKKKKKEMGKAGDEDAICDCVWGNCVIFDGLY
jgi:hypothetical protein